MNQSDPFREWGELFSSDYSRGYSRRNVTTNGSIGASTDDVLVFPEIVVPMGFPEIEEQLTFPELHLPADLKQ